MAQTEATQGARDPSSAPILSKFIRVEVPVWNKLVLIKANLRHAHKRKYSWSEVINEMAEQWDLERS